MDILKDFFNCSDCLLLDGAMGSNLMARGLAPGQAPEELLFTAPDTIKSLHRDFIAAGSDLILTNSLGGNARRLALHGDLHKDHGSVGAINARAAQLAREAAEEIGRPETLIAGSMGPTGDLLAPLGPLSVQQAEAIYAEQAAGLADGGAHILWLETLAAEDEVLAAVAGAHKVGLPIALTLSFDSAGRTMMGLSPLDFAALADTLPLIAYGANCGAGLSDMALVMQAMAAAKTSDKALIAKGNCGIPKFADGEVRYDGTPVLMGAYANLMRSLGIALIGGCCGTTPRHIEAMRAALDGPSPLDEPSLSRAQIERLLGPTTVQDPATQRQGRERKGRRRAA